MIESEIRKHDIKPGRTLCCDADQKTWSIVSAVCDLSSPLDGVKLKQQHCSHISGTLLDAAQQCHHRARETRNRRREMCNSNHEASLYFTGVCSFSFLCFSQFYFWGRRGSSSVVWSLQCRPNTPSLREAAHRFL